MLQLIVLGLHATSTTSKTFVVNWKTCCFDDFFTIFFTTSSTKRTQNNDVFCRNTCRNDRAYHGDIHLRAGLTVRHTDRIPAVNQESPLGTVA